MMTDVERQCRSDPQAHHRVELPLARPGTSTVDPLGESGDACCAVFEEPVVLPLEVALATLVDAPSLGDAATAHIRLLLRHDNAALRDAAVHELPEVLLGSRKGARGTHEWAKLCRRE